MHLDENGEDRMPGNFAMDGIVNLIAIAMNNTAFLEYLWGEELIHVWSYNHLHMTITALVEKGNLVDIPKVLKGQTAKQIMSSLETEARVQMINYLLGITAN